MMNNKYLEDAKRNIRSDNHGIRDIAKSTIKKYLEKNNDAYCEYKEVLTDNKRASSLSKDARQILSDIVEEYEEMAGLLEDEG